MTNGGNDKWRELLPLSFPRRRESSSVVVYEKNASQRCPTGLYKGRWFPCKTPAGFGSVVDIITQGGAAAPLTLGYEVQPPWGKDIRTTIVFRKI